MKRIAIVTLAALVMVWACVAYAAEASPEASSPRPTNSISLTIYLVDAQEQPIGNAVVLLQRSLNSDEAYEGKTDGRGAVMIPTYPLTGFVLAVRNDSDAITGLADVSLYPGTDTKILNSPQTGNDSVAVDDLQNTGLSNNVNGSAPITADTETIPMHRYEVEVADGTRGVACLFQQKSGNELTLLGVSEGQAGVIAPEPTLPPGDPDAPDEPSQTPGSASPSGEPSATATGGPSSAEPSTSETPPSSSVTEPGSSAPAQSSTETPASSSPPAPTPTPTPTPTAPPVSTPQPTAVPTTDPAFVNMKLFLKGKDGAALAYYVAILNDVAQAAANGEGEAYFTNVPTESTNQLVVKNPDGNQVGLCGIRFVQGETTTLASVNSGGTYTINYAPGAQDVYVEIVVDTGGTANTPITLEEASDQPLDPGTPAAEESAPAPADTETPQTESSQPQEDIIGLPSTSGPTLQGYFSTEAGVAISGATIRLLNADTKNLSSSVTNTEGEFSVNRVPPGNYILSATSSSGSNMGRVSFSVVRGKKTQVKTAKDGNLYLTENSDDNTVYLDLREMSNGTVDLMYASKSPLTAPAVLTQRTPRPSSADQNLAVEEQITTEVFEPTTREEPPAETGTVVLVIVLCVAGVAVAAVLLTRHAHIR